MQLRSTTICAATALTGALLGVSACGTVDTTDSRSGPASSDRPVMSTTRTAVPFVAPTEPPPMIVSTSGSCAAPPGTLEEALAYYMGDQEGDKVVRGTVSGVAGPAVGIVDSSFGEELADRFTTIQTPFALTGVEHLDGAPSPIAAVWVLGGQIADDARDDVQLGLTPGSDVILDLTPVPAGDGVDGFYGRPVAYIAGDVAYVDRGCVTGVTARDSRQLTEQLPVFTYEGFGTRGVEVIELPTDVLLEDLERARKRPRPLPSGS